MASKEQAHSPDKATTKVRVPQFGAQNSAAPDQQINPARIAQPARLAPRLFTHRDMLQLQRTIGNRGVGRFLAQTTQPLRNVIQNSSHIATIQRTLNPSNIEEFYHLTPKKKGNVQVFAGMLKEEHQKSGHPKNVVFKQGLGADEDSKINQMLEGMPGIYKVIDTGKDYFIRAGYDDKDAFTTWKEMKPFAKKVIQQAADLSIHMLNKGVIDKDRKVFESNNGEIELHNMHISKQDGATVHFFDFEPIGIIDWGKKLQYPDIDNIDKWISTYSGICANLAKNLGADEGQAQKLIEEGAHETLKSKGHEGVWKQLQINDDEDSGEGSYVPPLYVPPPSSSILIKKDKELEIGKNKEANKEKINEEEQNRRGRVSDILFQKMENYYDISNDTEKFRKACELLQDWYEGFDKDRSKFVQMMKLMTIWKEEVAQKKI